MERRQLEGCGEGRQGWGVGGAAMKLSAMELPSAMTVFGMVLFAYFLVMSGFMYDSTLR